MRVDISRKSSKHHGYCWSNTCVISKLNVWSIKFGFMVTPCLNISFAKYFMSTLVASSRASCRLCWSWKPPCLRISTHVSSSIIRIILLYCSNGIVGIRVTKTFTTFRSFDWIATFRKDVNSSLDHFLCLSIDISELLVHVSKILLPGISFSTKETSMRLSHPSLLNIATRQGISLTQANKYEFL